MPPEARVPGADDSERGRRRSCRSSRRRSTRRLAASLGLVAAEHLARIRVRRSRTRPGSLPTFGIGIGLPLFDRNRGGIAQAEAERVRGAGGAGARAGRGAQRDRARACASERTRSRKVARDRQLVASADRVAAMSLTAYREGASSLPNVLEAQRNARDVLGAVHRRSRRRVDRDGRAARVLAHTHRRHRRHETSIS